MAVIVKISLLSSTQNKYGVVHPEGGRSEIVCFSSNVLESKHSEENMKQLKCQEEEKVIREQFGYK